LARTAAQAMSPVVFFTEDGAQLEVPMSAIYFDNGVVGTDRPPDSSSRKLLLWLQYQASLGRIVSAPDPPASPAFLVEAATAGTYGNRIEITTAPAATPTAVDSVDVKVSATDRYIDVKVADLAGLLGTAGAKGTEPGLLQVADNPVGASEPTPGIIAEDPTATWKLGTGKKAVTLEPRTPGTDFDAGDVLVRVEPGGAPGTFALVVTWSAAVDDVSPADFSAAFTPKFDFLVTIAKPADGPFKAPRAGTLSLAGGSERTDATSARATVMADD
jgi:hypothetical protein